MHPIRLGFDSLKYLGKEAANRFFERGFEFICLGGVNMFAWVTSPSFVLTFYEEIFKNLLLQI